MRKEVFMLVVLALGLVLIASHFGPYGLEDLSANSVVKNLQDSVYNLFAVDSQVLFGGGCGGDGDFNGDLIVNYIDLEMLVPNYGTTDSFYDLDCSGLIDYGDLEIMNSNFQMNFDLNGDSQVDINDVNHIDTLLDKQLWDDGGYEARSDLFVDGVINSIDYSFLISQLSPQELGSKSIHRAQLMNTWVNNEERLDITKPEWHIKDYTFHWGVSFPNVPSDFSIFEAITNYSFVLDYVDSHSCHTAFPSSFLNCSDWGQSTGTEHWFLHYVTTNTTTIGGSCPFGYEPGDRVPSFCNSYPAADRYILQFNETDFQQEAAAQIAGPIISGDVTPGLSSTLNDGIAFDNVFYNDKIYVDTPYGPVTGGSTAGVTAAQVQAFGLTFRAALNNYTGTVKRALNEKGYKLISNSGNTIESPHPFDYINEFYPYIDGILDEGFSSRNCWTWGGCGNGFLEQALQNVDLFTNQNRIYLMMSYPKQAGSSTARRSSVPEVGQIGLDYYDPAINFEGTMREFFYSYAAFHMLKKPGLTYMGFGYTSSTSGKSFWAKDYEVPVGNALEPYVPLGNTDISPVDGTPRHHVFSRDFENARVFVRDQNHSADPDNLTFTLPSVYNSKAVSWYNRYGEIITDVTLRPFDGAFAYTFNPVGAIADLNNDGVANSTDILSLIPAQNTAYGDAQYFLEYDIDQNGLINSLDLTRLIQMINTQVVCGNSIIETGEQCDDGNTNQGDGCDEFCQLESQPTNDRIIIGAWESTSTSQSNINKFYPQLEDGINDFMMKHLELRSPISQGTYDRLNTFYPIIESGGSGDEWYWVLFNFWSNNNEVSWINSLGLYVPFVNSSNYTHQATPCITYDLWNQTVTSRFRDLATLSLDPQYPLIKGGILDLEMYATRPADNYSSYHEACYHPTEIQDYYDANGITGIPADPIDLVANGYQEAYSKYYFGKLESYANETYNEVKAINPNFIIGGATLLRPEHETYNALARGLGKPGDPVYGFTEKTYGAGFRSRLIEPWLGNISQANISAKPIIGLWSHRHHPEALARHAYNAATNTTSTSNGTAGWWLYSGEFYEVGSHCYPLQLFRDQISYANSEIAKWQADNSYISDLYGSEDFFEYCLDKSKFQAYSPYQPYQAGPPVVDGFTMRRGTIFHFYAQQGELINFTLTHLPTGSDPGYTGYWAILHPNRVTNDTGLFLPGETSESIELIAPETGVFGLMIDPGYPNRFRFKSKSHPVGMIGMQTNGFHFIYPDGDSMYIYVPGGVNQATIRMEGDPGENGDITIIDTRFPSTPIFNGIVTEIPVTPTLNLQSNPDGTALEIKFNPLAGSEDFQIDILSGALPFIAQNLSGLFSGFCGNSIAEGSEECDGNDFSGNSCFGQGFDGGSLGCVPSGQPNECTLNTTQCGSCGIIDSYWTNKTTGDPISTANTTNNVYAITEAQNCTFSQYKINFTFFVENGTNDYQAQSQPNITSSIIPFINKAIATWNASLENVIGSQDFYFNATIVQNNKTKLSNLLTVSDSQVNICGDLTCDSGENHLSCPSDCIIENRSQFLAFSSITNYTTQEDAIAAYTLASQNAEYAMIAAHINWSQYETGWQGVEDTKFDSLNTTNEIGLALGLKPYIEISPLQTGDNSIIDQEIPNSWGTKDFANPIVRTAFKNYVQRIINEINPDYLALGIEINGYYLNNPTDFVNYITLYNETYDLIKQTHPHIKVSPTFQYDLMSGHLGQPAHFELLDLFNKSDIVALSTYPRAIFQDTTSIPADYYTNITLHTSKSLVISESGWPTASSTFPSTEQAQKEFLTRFLAETNNMDVELLVWWFMHDWPGPGYDAGGFFNSSGLLNVDGSEKPAWAIWQQHHALPIVQAAICGNGVIETGEQCDNLNLAGDGCSTFGYLAGTLSCQSNSQSLIGTSYSPANMPDPSSQDITNFFLNSSEMGSSHVLFGTEWINEADIEEIRLLQTLVKFYGFDFHLHLSPIDLTEGRDSPAIPPSVNGNSFEDPIVREAFKQKALEFAALKPKYLGIGSEVNLLEVNVTEFPAYVSLTKETYDLVKQEYPNQDITISFQWDYIVNNLQYSVLEQFNESLDVYSFTTYPETILDPSLIPATYYTDIRTYLPTERIAFSEIGWSTAAPSNESIQAQFYARLPELFGGMGLEYATLASMHDIDFFTGALAGFNFVGLRNITGEPKLAWDTVVNLNFVGNNLNACMFDLSGCYNPCSLTGASWNTTTAIGGTVVELIVEGNNCAGQQINFTIWEDDGALGRDYIADSIIATFNSTNWISVWQEDINGLTSDPEYVFDAVLVENNSINVTSINLLDVSRMSECTTSAECLSYPEACVIPTCNAGVCEYTENDAFCSDGLFCTSLDDCSISAIDANDGSADVNGCVFTIRNCLDAVSCTVDSCNEGTDSCESLVDNSQCDNGLWCDGFETCDALLDCQAGTAPVCSDPFNAFCTSASCDESQDSCVTNFDDLICVAPAVCDPDEFSGGTGCGIYSNCTGQSDGAPCDNGIFCDGNNDVCQSEICVNLVPINPCDDGIACTIDVCSEGNGSGGTCLISTNNSICDDGLFCDGAEICDINLGCLDQQAPHNDTISCTVDSCDEQNQMVINIPNDSLCLANEVCIPAQDCSVAIPTTVNFDGNTTDFTLESDLTNVTNVTLENTQYGRIDFLDNTNVAGLDLDLYVNISNNTIEINSANPGMSNLNVPAQLWFYGIDVPNAIIFRDGVECGSCSTISYEDGVFIGVVPGFSQYVIGEHVDSGVDGSGDNSGDMGGGPGPGPPPVECVTQWGCTSWSECIEGVQTRSCSDQNDCDDDSNAPDEARECPAGPTAPEGEEQTEQTPTTARKVASYILIAGIVVLFFVMIAILSLIGRKKYKERKTFKSKYREMYELIDLAKKSMTGEDVTHYYKKLRAEFEARKSEIQKDDATKIRKEIMGIYNRIKK